MRALPRRLAGLALALAACHPRGASDGPGSRRERAAASEAGSAGVLDLAVAWDRTCAVRASGELRCWGDNRDGRLGDGTERTRRYPHPVHGMTDAVQVALGPSHACARHRDGRVSCWGSGSAGQLGDGTLEDRRTPVAVKDLRDAVDVSVGRTHSCAVLDGGRVWCWGDNQHGQLGDGTLRAHAVPAEVKGLPSARRVRVGQGFTCAIVRGDAVWCWGLDSDGLTGAAEPAPRCGDQDWSPACLTEPKASVSLPPVVDLAVGDRHACAVTREGQVRCWGSSFGCEHGVSKLEPVRTPQAIEALPPVASLPGPQCARARTGELLCWGRDRGAPGLSYGYSDAGYACAMERVLPELTREATRIAAHERGGCALREDQTLWCWGEGGSGQLGDGSEVSRPAGVQVTALDQPPPPPGPTPLEIMTRELLRAGVPHEGHALVWHDAPIYADATATRALGSLVDQPEELRIDRFTDRLPVRIVAAHGERLEVEPLGPGRAGGHCGGSTFPGFDHYALRVFVRAQDLAPVIAREYAMGYPDGSGVTLGAGVPLRPLEAGVVAYGAGLVLPLELAEGDAALAYDAPGLRTRNGYWWDLPTLASEAVLTLDDRRVYVDELPDRFRHVRWSRAEEAGVARVHTEDGCVGLDMIADDPVPTSTGGGAGGIGFGGTKQVVFTRVREGAPAYWPGGAKAGQVRASYRTREEPRPEGARRCLTLAASLLVCHDEADLSSETDSVPKWSGD